MASRGSARIRDSRRSGTGCSRRAMLVCLDDMAPQHRLRASRLVAAVLGEEALPMLIARAVGASLDEKLELLMLIVTLGGEAKLGLLEDALKGMKFADLSRQRAK